MEADSLWSGLVQRDRRALSRAITRVEGRAPGYRELLALAYEKARPAFRVGVTGPPGAGKSTLIDALVKRVAALGQSVCVLAVDPTSPFTGGALLGDRVRMPELAAHHEVYIRSMATRGATGGLAAATRDVCAVMEAFGCDWLVLETVGVGQTELDILQICDVVTAVFVPESGDGVQALKAGIVEAAQLFVVNKADRPGADRLAEELEWVVRLRAGTQEAPPVLRVQADSGRGVAEWHACLDALRARPDSAEGTARRARQVLAELEHVLRERLYCYLVYDLVRHEAWPDLAHRLARGTLDPHQGADRVWELWCTQAPRSSDATPR